MNEPIPGIDPAIAAAQATLRPVVEAGAITGEGPLWDAARGVLWWVDIPPGLLHRFDPVTGATATQVFDAPLGAVAHRPDGSLLLALADRLAAWDSETGRLQTLLPLPAGTVPLRCNDGKPDPQGRFWIGRMAVDEQPGAGSLLRIGSDGQVATVLAGLHIPNGLGWTADGGSMLYVDSAWGEVRRYAFDARTGAIGEARTLVRVEDGVPDGLTLDAEGCAWIALWGGHGVRRVAPDGRVLGDLRLPVSQVSSCTFGGPDMGTLFITTARKLLPPQALVHEPQAGSLFSCRPGVRGLAPGIASL
jgi:sugar lactone lactonase YvrE